MTKMFLKICLEPNDLRRFLGLVTLALEVRPVTSDGAEVMVGDRKNEVASICDGLSAFISQRADEAKDAPLTKRVAEVFSRFSEALTAGQGGDAISIVIETILSSIVLPLYDQAALSLVRRAPTLENWKVFIKNMSDK